MKYLRSYVSINEQEIKNLDDLKMISKILVSHKFNDDDLPDDKLNDLYKNILVPAFNDGEIKINTDVDKIINDYIKK
jgi:hypothetical protein